VYRLGMKAKQVVEGQQANVTWQDGAVRLGTVIEILSYPPAVVIVFEDEEDDDYEFQFRNNVAWFEVNDGTTPVQIKFL